MTLRSWLRRRVPPITELPVGAGEHDPSKRDASRRVRESLRRIEQMEREADVIGRHAPRRHDHPEPST